MRALLAVATLLVLAPAAHAASGMVESGHQDGGRFAYAIDAPGWKRVAGAPADYTFRLSRRGVTLTVGRSGTAGSAAELARTYAARGHGRRTVQVDAHHAEVLDAAGHELMAFADAGGPFRVAFLVQAQSGQGASLVHAVAHGARFRWAGPDVRHLPLDPKARELIAATNLALSLQDSYRDEVTVAGKPAYEVERVRSRRYEDAVYHDGKGLDRQRFVGGHGYERRGSATCWSHSLNVAGDETFDPISNPLPGPFTGYGHVIAQEGLLMLVETFWTDQADTVVDTLAFDAHTHLLVTRTSDAAQETFSWIPVTVQPATPLCPGTGPRRGRS
jgi:hypothetical protein